MNQQNTPYETPMSLTAWEASGGVLCDNKMAIITNFGIITKFSIYSNSIFNIYGELFDSN